MEPLKVEKFSTTDRGNGLRALAPLRPGELLFRSDPLAYTVCKGSRGLVCERCLLGKEKLMRCSQCRVAKYCSAKCQKKAWPDHKRECKCLKSCKPRYPPDSVRLLGRVVVKLMEETPSESEKLYSFYDLESNVSKLTEDKKEGIRQLAVTFQHFMREEVQDMSQLPPAFDVFEAFAKVTLIKMSGGPGNDPEGQDFFTFSKRSFLLTDEASRHPRMKNSNMCIDSPKTYFTVRSLEEVISAMLQHPSFGLSWTTLHISPSRFAVLCNAFTICDAEMQGVGVGLYPSMSLLNHSCDPNCSVVFNGPHLLLRAVRDVEAGEELTICYLDLLMTSEERREHLRGQYCFDCDCVRCQTQDKDADMLTGDEQVWKEVRESLKKIEELKAQWKWEQVLAMCQVILSSNAERLPDINIYQLKVLDCAMDACIHLGLLEEALFYGLRTMEPYRVFFPGSHPVRGVQVMKVGKLQLHQGMLPQAMKNLRLAFDIMRVTHGREHRLMEDLILLLEECDVSIRAS